MQTLVNATAQIIAGAFVCLGTQDDGELVPLTVGEFDQARLESEANAAVRELANPYPQGRWP